MKRSKRILWINVGLLVAWVILLIWTIIDRDWRQVPLGLCVIVLEVNVIFQQLTIINQHKHIAILEDGVRRSLMFIRGEGHDSNTIL